MVKGINLECQKREISNRRAVKEMRNQGMVPGIIYGKGIPSQPVALNGRELTRVFTTQGQRGLFSLNFRGEKPVLSLVREVQRNPITGELLHIDFLQVKMTEKITASVPVIVSGEEEASKTGGIVQASLKEVEVECLPGDLPDEFMVDISHLEIGEKLVVADLPGLEGVEVLTPGDTAVVVLLQPSKEEEVVEETPEEEEGKEQLEHPEHREQPTE